MANRRRLHLDTRCENFARVRRSQRGRALKVQVSRRVMVGADGGPEAPIRQRCSVFEHTVHPGVVVTFEPISCLDKTHPVFGVFDHELCHPR
jgi:hypothetical protein